MIFSSSMTFVMVFTTAGLNVAFMICNLVAGEM
jgi:hypothetical protein